MKIHLGNFLFLFEMHDLNWFPGESFRAYRRIIQYLDAMVIENSHIDYLEKGNARHLQSENHEHARNY